MRARVFGIAILLIAHGAGATEPSERRELRFPCGEVRCAGTLFLPGGVVKPPVAILGHGFGGTRLLQLPAYAETFAPAGVASFVFDYRFLGESDGQPRQIIDAEAQVADWVSALAFVRGLPEIDANRIALWGTSFSGGHVIIVAAGDPEIRAVVAQAPLVDADAGADPDLGWALRALSLAAWDVMGSWFGRAPHTIPIVRPAGEFALVRSPGAWDAFRSVLADPVGGWRNEVAARVLFSMAGYRPIERIAEVRCPILLLPARGDRVVPIASVEDAASRAPQAELYAVEGSHFDVYAGELFHRLAAVQAAFLARHLGPAPAEVDPTLARSAP